MESGDPSQAGQPQPVLTPAELALQADVPKELIRPPAPKRRLRGLLPAIILLVVLVAMGLLLALEHTLVTDWLVTRGYHAPAPVQSLVEQDRMTAYAKRLFYVNHPQIQERATFNKNCSDANDQVSVLGCYAGNRQGIYVYDVTDPRLYGIQQVTVAHEMLHQAYDRLSTKERTRVDLLLEAYAKTVTDPELKAKIAAYQQTEPHDVVNEMHSVFGTEVDSLPPALETYYKQYFTNRRAVTVFHDRYQAAFTQRQQQIARYDAQIDGLKKQVDANKADITGQERSLQDQRTQLNTYISNNQPEQYNAAVPGFNAQVAQYRTLIDQTNTLIDQYNTLINERNAIAVQEQQLDRAIDSHASDVTKQ